MSGAAGDGKHNASSKTYGAVRRCWRCGYVDVMGNVRVDSEFESGAARGGGGDAGLLPAIMRGFKVEELPRWSIAPRGVQDRDFSSWE